MPNWTDYDNTDLFQTKYHLVIQLGGSYEVLKPTV